MRYQKRALLLTSAMLSLAFASSAHAATCADLIRLKLPDSVITRADLVGAGEFEAPDKTKRPDLPSFCRVVVSVKAAPDSDIGVEVWLPTKQWQGVFHGNGNGGFGGSLSAGYPGMEAGLLRGYATAVTDMGTSPATTLNGDALIGHPQKWKDWGLLSTHVMTVTGKAIAKAFYGEDAKRSYYTGCSTGGQQGLIEAEYYPEDYNGILIGAPVVNRTLGHAVAVWDYQAANLQPDHKLSDAKLALLHTSVLKACGGTGNGLSADSFVGDPLACKFDPATLICKEAATEGCLTPGEVETVRKFYSGPVSPAGAPLYYGWLRGSEAPVRAGWSFLESTPEPAFDGLFKWVFGLNWDWRGFDFTRDMPKVDKALGTSVNGAMEGNISPFRARGGKLVMFQGLADTLVAPEQTIAFYNGLNGKSGGSREVQDSARLFLAPGVMHCGGGSGPDAFNAANGGQHKPPSDSPQDDLFSALARWVEDGVAPVRVIATKYVEDTPAKGVAMQRPLCAYPGKAWYKGTGDISDARNFICAGAKPPG